jgi:hypothetical protein
MVGPPAVKLCLRSGPFGGIGRRSIGSAVIAAAPVAIPAIIPVIRTAIIRAAIIAARVNGRAVGGVPPSLKLCSGVPPARMGRGVPWLALRRRAVLPIPLLRRRLRRGLRARFRGFFRCAGRPRRGRALPRSRSRYGRRRCFRRRRGARRCRAFRCVGRLRRGRALPGSWSRCGRRRRFRRSLRVRCCRAFRGGGRLRRGRVLLDGGSRRGWRRFRRVRRALRCMRWLRRGRAVLGGQCGRGRRRSFRFRRAFRRAGRRRIGRKRVGSRSGRGRRRDRGCRDRRLFGAARRGFGLPQRRRDHRRGDRLPCGGSRFFARRVFPLPSLLLTSLLLASLKLTAASGPARRLRRLALCRPLLFRARPVDRADRRLRHGGGRNRRRGDDHRNAEHADHRRTIPVLPPAAVPRPLPVTTA